MSKFKVGDRVREIATGDEGIFTDQTSYGGRPFVHWVTGDCKGQTLTISESGLMLCETTVDTVEQALQVLTNAGYSVTLTKRD